MKFNPLRMYRATKRFFREAHYSLMGHRDREIRHDISELRGSIVAMKLESFIDSCVNPDSSPNVAVVTCLPPDETGIARFSEIMLVEAAMPVDIYTEFQEYNKLVYAIGSVVDNIPGSNIYSIDRVIINHLKKKYNKIVFVIGNSDHNIVLLRAMCDFIKAFGARDVWCYLHDPTCFNVVRRVMGLSERQFVETLTKMHGMRLSDSLNGDRYIFDHLLEQGIHGPRVLTQQMGVRNFIVNSYAARDILIDNCADGIDAIEVLYHPVFELESGVVIPDQPSSPLTVGTYGCPSNMKHTDMVIQACEILIGEGVDLRLIISGYEAETFAVRFFHGHLPGWISVSHAETEAEFQSQMAKCDIALQLRKRNTGESSGVIPTLLRMGKTVITSAIGAFGDYGDAVLYFKGDAKDLAAMLRARPFVDAETIVRYVLEHDAAAFARRFTAVLGVADSVHTDPVSDGAVDATRTGPLIAEANERSQITL